MRMTSLAISRILEVSRAREPPHLAEMSSLIFVMPRRAAEEGTGKGTASSLLRWWARPRKPARESLKIGLSGHFGLLSCTRNITEALR